MDRAVDTHIGAIEDISACYISGLCQRGERGLLEAAARPAIEPVVDCGARPILRWAVVPEAARGEHVQNAGDDLPAVPAHGSGRIPGHDRFDYHPVLIREPKQVSRCHLQAAKRPPRVTKRRTLHQLGASYTLNTPNRSNEKSRITSYDTTAVIHLSNPDF